MQEKFLSEFWNYQIQQPPEEACRIEKLEHSDKNNQYVRPLPESILKYETKQSDSGAPVLKLWGT